MRRLAAIGVVLAAIALGGAVAGSPATSADAYRVDAVFDTAKGVVPGQLVKIAGARVGEIEAVTLTPEYRARISMRIPRQFSFRRDARCEIQPEGLISENFVQCDPGSPSEPPLRAAGELPPTVPVERTAVPVSLTDLFRIFQVDVRQRFTVAVAAVGGGLAARGPDLNAVLRRANPTLAAVRTLTRDLAAQRRQLTQAVEDTDRVLAVLARRRGAVRAFLEQADRVSARTADRRGELAEAIRRLPPLLDATDGAVAELDRLATRGRPLLARLRDAAPGLERLLDEVGPFSRAGRPALRELARTAEAARPVIGHARPLVRRLRAFAAAARPVGASLARTLVDLRERGFVEHLNLFAYYGAAAQARFDSISHIFPAHPVLSSCSPYAEEPVEGCNAFYHAPGEETAARRRPGRRAGGDGQAPRERAPEPDGPERRPRPAVPVDLPELPQQLEPVTDLTQQLARPLAEQLDEQLRKTLPEDVRDALKRDEGDRQALLDFLLGP